MPQQDTVTISYNSIIKVIIVLILIAFLYLIRDILLILFLSIILASALDPLVNWFEKYKIPRALSLLVIYILILGIIGLVIFLFIPPLSLQIKQIAANLPLYYETVTEKLNALRLGSGEVAATPSLVGRLESFAGYLESFATRLFPAVKGVISGGAGFFLVLVLTFYLVVYDRGLKKFIRDLTPLKWEPYITSLVNRIQEKMGRWLRGQLFLSLVVFALSAIGLLLIGVQYWLLLSIVAGILEIIPFIGPTIAAVVAFLLTVTMSPFQALLVVGLFIVIQQIENHVIVPSVMKRATGLNPIVVILLILIGARLAGVIGALIAIPLATAIGVVLGDVMKDHRRL